MPNQRTTDHSRRLMPRLRKARNRNRRRPVVTMGDLIVAAYDALGETRTVARVIGSSAMAVRIGRQVIVGL